MGFNCGIIGLPNVGKSTIFNALSKAGAQTANYPFCTIEPNKGIVIVPDERLARISEILKKDKPIPTRIEFIDVAGLVKGASKGEGLGNKFLGHIRNVEALIHVVRCFKSRDIIHVTGHIDPVRDIEIINTELCLSDLDVLERAREKLIKLARSGDKPAKKKADLMEKLIAHLNSGGMLNSLHLENEEAESVREYGLITIKPVLYCANADEGSMESPEIKTACEYAEKHGSEFIALSGKIEEEISELPDDERDEYLNALGLKDTGFKRLADSAYKLLGLITYYTAATDLQAWTVREGTTASKAAGKIHTDFEKGFIRAEVFHYNELVKAGSEHHIREQGHLRSEGKEYVIKDGDIVRYLHS